MTLKQREAMQKAIEFLLFCYRDVPMNDYASEYREQIEQALREALAEPDVPEGWLRAIDEALVVSNIGIAEATDSYEVAKRKLNQLLDLHIKYATDHRINGGWRLVPIEPTLEMIGAAEDQADCLGDFYRAMLAAAPEYKE